MKTYTTLLIANYLLQFSGKMYGINEDISAQLNDETNILSIFHLS